MKMTKEEIALEGQRAQKTFEAIETSAHEKYKAIETSAREKYEAVIGSAWERYQLKIQELESHE